MSDRGAMLNAAGEGVAVEPIAFDDLGDDEILVRLTASGVCHTDLHVKNGHGLLDERDLAGAQDHLVRACDLARAIPDILLLVRGQALLGLCRLRRGELDAAIADLEDADRIIRQRHVRLPHATTARNGLVEVYLAASERSEREVWLYKARQASKESFRQAKFDRAALPAAYRWRGTYEWSCGEAAAARTWWERSAAEAKAMGLPLELDQTREERTRRETQSSSPIGFPPRQR